MERSFNNDWSEIKQFILCLCIIFIFTNSMCASELNWLLKLRKLKILESTKEEVERMFDNPKIVDYSNLAKKEKNGWGEKIEYKTKEGYLEALYSTGKCAESKSEFGYDVDKETLVELHFYPFDEVSYSKLGFDLNQFDSKPVIDVYNTYSFRNKRLGVEITINNEKVSSIHFVPSSTQEIYGCKDHEK